MNYLPTILFILCFNISTSLAQLNCENYGLTNGSTCACPPGFGGDTCAVPTCGGNVFQGAARPLAPVTSGSGDISACGCETGWGGAGCNICQTPDSCQAAFGTATGTTNSIGGSPNTFNPEMKCSTQPRVYASGEMSCQVIVSAAHLSLRQRVTSSYLSS
jgi:hypothetical protein